MVVGFFFSFSKWDVSRVYRIELRIVLRGLGLGA